MRKFFRRALAVFAALLLIFTLAGFSQTYRLTTTSYDIDCAELADGLCIVQLSDLHDARFGKENARLIEAVREAKPDLIAMTGDMFNRDADKAEIEAILRLIEALSSETPVCYSLGNHELEYIEANGDGILSRLEQSGAIVLEKRFVELTLRGQEIRVGGSYGYLLSHHYSVSGPEQDFMDEFTDTSLPTLLLSHLPHGLLQYGSMKDWDVDLILCGHVHGGQMRLPFVGGLFDPELGWFPEYTKGAYRSGGSVLVLSAGLGSASSYPRFYNPPELVVIDINGAGVFHSD